MTQKNLIPILIICLVLLEALNAKNEFFKYNTVLDHSNYIRLEWSYKLKSEGKNAIIFRLRVATALKRVPIIGFGMSDRGDFKNADLVLFQQNSKAFEQYDCHTNSQSEIIQDFKQNYLLLHAKTFPNPENSDQKVIEIVFERKIDTCDPEDYLIEGGTVHVVHFLFEPNNQYSSVADILSDNSNFVIEQNSNSFDMKQVQLIRSTYYEKSSLDTNIEASRYFDITNDKIKLPAQHTTYWCMVFKLNERFLSKHHIIAFEGLIMNTSKGIVHHMELFHCISDPSENMKQYNGECRSENKPVGLTDCRKKILNLNWGKIFENYFKSGRFSLLKILAG